VCTWQIANKEIYYFPLLIPGSLKCHLYGDFVERRELHVAYCFQCGGTLEERHAERFGQDRMPTLTPRGQMSCQVEWIWIY